MSVLNTMLRDLERRGERPAQPLPAIDIEPSTPAGAPSGAASKRSWRVRLLLLALACGAVAAAWVWFKPFAPPVQAPVMVAVQPTSRALAPASSAEASRAVAPAKSAELPSLPPMTAAESPVPQPEHPHTPTPVRTAVPPSTPNHPAANLLATAAPAGESSPPPAATLSRSPAQAELARASDLIARGRNAEAESVLRAILLAQPGWNDARMTLAAVQAESGRRTEALATLLDGVRLDAARFAPTAAQLQAELGDPVGAVQTLDQVATTSRDAAYHPLAAAIAQRAGLHEQAIEEYRQTLNSAPGDALSWVGLGVSLQALRRDAQALQAYQMAWQGSLSEDMRHFVRTRVGALQGAVGDAAAR